MNKAVIEPCSRDGSEFQYVGEYKCTICGRYPLSKKRVRGTVFAFMYSGDYESGLQVVSLHSTRIGADDAMRRHKQEKLDEFIDLYGVEELKSKDCSFGVFETWEVQEMPVLD